MRKIQRSQCCGREGDISEKATDPESCMMNEVKANMDKTVLYIKKW